MTEKETNHKIIVALDVATKDKALKLVDALREKIGFFKIGLQLYTSEGPTIVRELLSRGVKVFLDLKLNDIPNTVARTVESVSSLGVQMLTIHLSGGSEMIRAAITARRDNLSILGVTVLTSANEQTLQETGVSDKIQNQVLRLAKLGVDNGIGGIVASSHEITALREGFGHKINIVVPGIRPAGSESGDQKRTMTPREAINAGADYLVIGRPITGHKDPREAVEEILKEFAR